MAKYLRTFDASVDALMPREGPICAAMSGGLDSTFVVASLARHATSARPIHALVHSPIAQAGLVARGNWDPDDFPAASAMTKRFSNIVLHRFVNDQRRQPLTVAAESARRLWLPATNAFNQVWLRQMDALAADLGATRLFGGGKGNLAFSDSHMYAAGYHLSRREWGKLAAIATPYPGERVAGMLTGSGLLARQLSQAMSGLRGVPDPPHPWFPFVPQARPHVWRTHGTPRQRYLRGLAAPGQRRLVSAAAGWQAPPVDPFNTEPLMNLAAALQPAAWARAGYPRGFARLAARGRLPDEIRLRTRRGAQAGDAWYVIHDQNTAYIEAAEALVDDPTLGAWVDADTLFAELRSWPWGQAHAPEPARIHRVVAFLAFGVAWRTLRTMVSA